MFQSLTFGYGTGALYKKEIYILIDSDFTATGEATGLPSSTIVIAEYTKRQLNVAANLVLLFRYRAKKFGSIEAIENQLFDLKASRFFTPELKAQVMKYLALV